MNAAELAAELREKKQTRSLRRIAREDYGDESLYGTLSQVMNSNGNSLPSKRTKRGRELLRILGLVPEPKPLPEWMKAWRRLPKEKRERIMKDTVENENRDKT